MNRYMADKKKNTGRKVQKWVQLIEKKEKKKKKEKEKAVQCDKKKATTSNTSLMNQLSLL